jgi:anti-anti-sigma regulatory factor
MARKLRTSALKISGVSWGIQCDAFSTRTRRAFGISRDSLSPSRIVCQGSCAPHKHSVGALISPCFSTSMVVWFVLSALALRMIEIFPSSSRYGATMPASNSGVAKRRVIESGKAMLAMSTPVTSIWDGILLLPLVGIVDSQRTQDIMEKTLSRISESRARVFVMDISGVVTVDTAVANNFIRITQATRLMGCDCIISGISPSVARTLVELGANVAEVRTTATLRDALQLALATIEPHARDGRMRPARTASDALRQ